MQSFDLLIVLGAHIGVKDDVMGPALHTEMRIRAAGVAYQFNPTCLILCTGGHNVGVRYALDRSAPAFGTPGSDRKPDFSDHAKRRAKFFRSEASVMGEMLRRDYGVPAALLIYEEDSATTQENVQKCAEIVEYLIYHRPTSLGRRRIGILTMLYHMKRALGEFTMDGNDFRWGVIPVLAEDLLCKDDPTWVDRICEYYATPKGGKQYPVDEIRRLLTEGQSLEPLMA